MSVGNFAILAFVGPVLAIGMPWPMEMLGIQVGEGPFWTPVVSHTER